MNPELTSATLQNHTDGDWFTSNHEYKNYKLVIKMKPSKGAKIHVWHNDKVIKTFRYNFATEQQLLSKAQTFIDLHSSGACLFEEELKK